MKDGFRLLLLLTALLVCEEAQVSGIVKVDVSWIQDMAPVRKPVSAFPLMEQEGVPPADVKDRTLQYFLQHEETIHRQMRAGIYEYYTANRRAAMPYLATIPGIDRIFPAITTGHEIDTAVHLAAMDISPDGRMLRFTYEVDWDVEHGLELVVRDDQVVDIGPAGEVPFR